MSFVAFRTWVAGEVVTAAEGNEQWRDNGNFIITNIDTTDGSLKLFPTSSKWTQFARASTSYTANASTSMASMSDLSVTVGQGQVWHFQAHLIMIGTTVANVSFQMSFPGTVSSVAYGVTGRPVGSNAMAITTTSATVSTLLNGANGMHAVISGVVVTGTSGTMQLRFGQNVSEASNTTIFPNSSLVAIRIS